MSAIYVQRARAIYRLRRDRVSAFPELSELLGEPVWDILLDLYVQQHAHRSISISSSCIAADVPPTTALRYIAAMIDRGLVERYPDPRDRRRSLLRLPEATCRSIERVLDRAEFLGAITVADCALVAHATARQISAKAAELLATAASLELHLRDG